MYDAQLIEKLFLGQKSIVYLMCSTMRFYRPVHWLDYYDTHSIMCA